MRREDTDWWLAVSFPPSLFRLHDKFASCDTLLHIMSTNWKEEIYNALIRRNKLQTQPFVALIEQVRILAQRERVSREEGSRALREVNELRRRNEELTHQVETLRQKVGQLNPELELQLQQRINKLQEELAAAYKQISEGATHALELNKQLTQAKEEHDEKARLVEELTRRLDEQQNEHRQLLEQMKKSELDNNVLKEELQSLQLELVHTYEKVKNLEKENKELVDRLLKKSTEDAKKLNEANQLYQSLLEQTRRQQLIQQAKANSPALTSTLHESLLDRSPSTVQVVVPKTLKRSVTAHDGEVNTLAYSSTGLNMCSGGQDKVVKIWDTPTTALKASLTGCTQSVMSVAYDWANPNDHVIAASNDNAARVWTIAGGINRVQHTLMGHISRVSQALFSFDNLKAITGSHDRTIKVWDLQKGYCIRTIFCYSSCNSLCLSYDGIVIVSGHLDSNLRFWDVKTGECIRALESLHSQQITSVVLSPDGHSVLTNARDNCLKLVDIRNYAEIQSFKHETYRTGVNWAKACFSPDGRYIASGSADGYVFIWEVASGKIDSILKKGHKTTVIAVAWHPSGHQIASCDRNGQIVFWE
jgi:autophagy-related protein 16